MRKVFVFALFLVLVGCHHVGSIGGNDAGSQDDSDTTSTDSDVDMDADVDIDIDADSDTDTDTETETESVSFELSECEQNGGDCIMPGPFGCPDGSALATFSCLFNNEFCCMPLYEAR